jgi:glyoxylase-like metal-dependent hydrolase (beta-lactamase superfamily II)
MDVEGEMGFASIFDEMPPPVPAEQLHERYPDDYVKAAWRFRCRCFLIEGSEGAILVDLGSGPEGSAVHQETGLAGTLLEDLAVHGISPSDVSDVILTHAHSDHTGWCSVAAAGGYAPTFPNARYHLHPADVAMAREIETEDDRVWWEQVFAPLEARGQLVATEADAEIAPGVRTVHTPGHTPGHRVVVVGSGRDQVVVAGDLLHFTHQLEDAEWLSPFDEDPATALRTRLAMLDQIEREGGTLATAHLPIAFARLARRDGVRALVPLPERD